MTKMKLDMNDIATINFFENFTKVKVKDYFNDEQSNKMVFVLQNGEIKKILKNKFGVENIKKLEQKFGKKLRIIEFNDNAALFVRNCVLPLKVDDVIIEEKIITIKSQDREVKSMIIGKHASSLNNLKELVSRYFNGYDIKVE